MNPRMNKHKTILLGAACGLGLATAQAHAANFNVLALVQSKRSAQATLRRGVPMR